MWAITADAAPPVVVDAGFTPRTAARRGREIVADPIEILGRPGVQDDELAFRTGRHAGRGAIGHTVEPADVVALVRLNFARRVRFVGGDEELAPGITLHRVGGHAPGLQVVRVDTAGGPRVLASDATHFYANLRKDRPFAIVHSLPGMYAAFDRARALAGGDEARVVPGHDPLVLARHPPAGAALEGVAVELTPGSRVRDRRRE